MQSHVQACIVDFTWRSPPFTTRFRVFSQPTISRVQIHKIHIYIRLLQDDKMEHSRKKGTRLAVDTTYLTSESAASAPHSSSSAWYADLVPDSKCEELEKYVLDFQNQLFFCFTQLHSDRRVLTMILQNMASEYGFIFATQLTTIQRIVFILKRNMEDYDVKKLGFLYLQTLLKNLASFKVYPMHDKIFKTKQIPEESMREIEMFSTHFETSDVIQFVFVSGLVSILIDCAEYNVYNAGCGLKTREFIDIITSVCVYAKKSKICNVQIVTNRNFSFLVNLLLPVHLHDVEFGKFFLFEFLYYSLTDAQKQQLPHVQNTQDEHGKLEQKLMAAITANSRASRIVHPLILHRISRWYRLLADFVHVQDSCTQTITTEVSRSLDYFLAHYFGKLRIQQDDSHVDAMASIFNSIFDITLVLLKSSKSNRKDHTENEHCMSSYYEQMISLMFDFEFKIPLLFQVLTFCLDEFPSCKEVVESYSEPFKHIMIFHEFYTTTTEDFLDPDDEIPDDETLASASAMLDRVKRIVKL